MTITVQAVQDSNTVAEVLWTTTDPDPVAGFEVAVDVNAAGFIGLGVVSGTARRFVDVSGLWVPGDAVIYRVTDQDSAVFATFTFTPNDLDKPFTYSPVDSSITIPRYTTLEKVKEQLGISTTSKDERITEDIVAVELAIDMELGNRFPSTGDNPRWPYVPAPIQNLARDAATGAYTASNSPHGVAGSDEFMGTISVQDVVSQSIRRSPYLRGYQISFGFAS